MTLWLVRHAEPQVGQGVCYGALDVPAHPGPTLRAAQALAAELPHGTRMRVSPLQRCEQLAQALLGLRPDLMPETDARLREMDFGQWEGQPWEAIARHELDTWATHFSTWRCGGGESVQAVMARVGAAWDEVWPATAPTAWITHAGVIRAASLLARGERQVLRADQWPLAAPAFGQWYRFGKGAGPAQGAGVLPLNPQ